MQVEFDEQIFLAQRHGGISRYFVNLIATLRSAPQYGVRVRQGWRWSSNSHANAIGLSRPIAALDRLDQRSPLSLGGYHLANFGARRAARQANAVHRTYYHPRFLRMQDDRPLVITIYDMIPELYPKEFPLGNPHLGKAQYIAAADMIICISESAKRDLVAICGDPGVPMPVTHLGVDPIFSPDLLAIPAVPERFLLYVGRRGGYKDFDVLLEAFAGSEDRGMTLVAVGGGPFDAAERFRLSSLRIEGRVRHLEVTDLDLARLYATAQAFVLPSRHEGFGLPALEAMACGAPVVLAASSSLPEVGGDVARYFPPGDSAALRLVLDEIVGDRALRMQLRAQGIARAALFTWEATTRATAAAYRQLVPLAEAE